MKKAINKENTKAIVVSISALAGLGALYYFLIYKKKAAEEENNKRADFIVDGFVYTVGTKAKAYPKKVGEFGGYQPEPYKQDDNFWLAKNSKYMPILLKKSDVKIV